MTWAVATFTVIHVAPKAQEPVPYAVVIARGRGGQAVARADGELGWLEIGAPVEIADGVALPATGD